MAYINWNSGKPIPIKGPLGVQPYLTTITPDNPSGYTAYTGNLNFAYVIKTDGSAEYAAFKGGIEKGTLLRQFKTLEDAVNNGYITGAALSTFRTRLSNSLTERNTAILKGEQDPSPYFLANNPGWKPPTQSLQPAPPQNPTGISSSTSTSGQSGAGDPAPVGEATFGVTIENFNKDSEFQHKDWLHYPKNIKSNYQDRIVITQRRYVAPDVLTGGNIDLDKIKAGNFSIERFSTKEKLLGTVILPMPNDISETNQTAWGEDSLSSLAGLIAGGALKGVRELTGGNIPGTADAALSVLQQITKNDTSANEVIKQLLNLNAASAVTKFLGININPEAFRTRVTGTAINPNLELLFQGPKLRSFGFQFKMTPRSQEEARNIRYIIKFFKKGMAPKRNINDPKAAYFLGAPNVFDIDFKSFDPNNTNDSFSPSKSIVKIKTCALQQCVVNYTPDGFYTAFNDSLAGGSQPISVIMQLAFTELTPLYNDNYLDDDSVGFTETLQNQQFIPEGTDVDTTSDVGQNNPRSIPVQPAGQITSPVAPLIQPTGAFKPTLGLPGA